MNEAIIKELINILGIKSVCGITKTFIEDSGKRIDFISEAYKKNNINEICRQAHSLEGAASNLGLVKLANISSKTRSYAVDGDMEKTKEQIDNLYSSFKETVVWLEEKTSEK